MFEVPHTPYICVMLFLLTIFWPDVQAASNTDMFERKVAFDDKQLTSSSLWSFNDLSKPECALECYSDTSCVGFHFAETGPHCSGFPERNDGTAPSTNPMPGNQLYETNGGPGAKCGDDSSCQPLPYSHCHEGRCRCDIGYSRDGHTCRHLAECSTYNDVFDAFFSQVVYGHDLTEDQGLTKEQCIQACIDTVGCKSADFRITNGDCYPAAYSWHEFPDGRATDTTFYHYRRNCLTWQA